MILSGFWFVESKISHANSGPRYVKETRAHKVKDMKKSNDFPSAE